MSGDNYLKQDKTYKNLPDKLYLRLPPHLLLKIYRLANSRGINSQVLLREIIAKYFNEHAGGKDEG